VGTATGRKESSLSNGNGHKNGNGRKLAIPQAINEKRAVSTEKKVLSSSGVVALGFVFAGGCGTNNARRFMASMAPEDFPYLFVLVANTDGPQLKEFFDPSAINYDLDDAERANLGKWIASIGTSGQLTIIELGESGSGAGGDPEIGRMATEAKRDEFEQWMKPLRTVILSGGAGKGTGGGALPIIQKIAKSLDKCPLTIVTMPFAYEGGGRMKKAIATLRALYEEGPTMPIFNENVPLEQSKGKGFKEIFNEINNASIQPVFFGIREVTQVVGDMQNVDIADWRKVLSGGNYVTCDYTRLGSVKEGAEPAEEENIKVFIQRLLRQNPYQDHRTRKNATGILAWAHGAWNPDEVKSVVKVATDDLNPGIAEDLEVFSGIHIGTDASKWMMILSVASKGPELLFFHKGNGATTNERRTAVIYVPIEGQNRPMELMVQPTIAERWKSLYTRRFEDLTADDLQEFAMLAMVIREQSGQSVSFPTGPTNGNST
jgi:cell division GTPase FtsZ